MTTWTVLLIAKVFRHLGLHGTFQHRFGQFASAAAFANNVF